MKHRMLSATLLGLAFSFLAIGASVAYIGDNPFIVKLDAPREVACSDPVTITAKVRSSDTSDPAVEQTVIWDVKTSLSPDDAVSPEQTTTDSEGRTSAILTFGQVEGTRSVRVVIATWPTTIRVTCVGAVAAASPSPSPSAEPVPSATAMPSPTISPSASPVPSPSPSPDVTQSTDDGSLTAAMLPIALVVVVVLGLGGLLLFARRR
ncbi:MAG: hypothetical protein ABI797_03175 [Chloroflexota bacterium]